jgi:iron only hydrogenase large subunit-like protein
MAANFQQQQHMGGPGQMMPQQQQQQRQQQQQQQQQQQRPSQSSATQAQIQQIIFNQLNQPSSQPLTDWQQSLMIQERMGLIFNL